MAQVVFMRGVNVGGHKAFRPAALAKELSAFDVVNIGAAGTFVVRGKVTQAVLRAELQRRLPFEADFMVCRARELIDLAAADPFAHAGAARDTRRFLSVLARRPRTRPEFPVSYPARGRWQVRVVGLEGRFVLSLWRRVGRTLIYPNEVVEKELSLPATTRNWNTIAKIQAILRNG